MDTKTQSGGTSHNVELQLKPGSRAFGPSIADFLLLTEPLWVAGALSFVYFSVILGAINYSWVGLVVALIPFPLRLIRRGYLGLRTPFDLPIALFLAGALVGLWASVNFSLSLGAFQSCLAAWLLYYSIVNYQHPAHLVSWGLVLASVALIVATALNLRGVSFPISDWTELSLARGLVMNLVVLAALLAGITLFARRNLVRLIAGPAFLIFLLTMALGTGKSWLGLWSGLSFISRTEIWQTTLDMLRNHPYAGLGLGCFHLRQSQFPSPHNAFLDLYANMGVFGVIAALCATVICLRLALGILRSSRRHPWYGFAVGSLAATLVLAAVGLLESLPVGIVEEGRAGYYWIASPLFWMLAGGLVLAGRELKAQA